MVLWFLNERGRTNLTFIRLSWTRYSIVLILNRHSTLCYCTFVCVPDTKLPSALEIQYCLQFEHNKCYVLKQIRVFFNLCRLRCYKDLPYRLVHGK